MLQICGTNNGHLGGGGGVVTTHLKLNYKIPPPEDPTRTVLS